MYIVYKKSKVYYNKQGSGNNTIVFLHGWGGSTKSFDFICKDLKDEYKCLFIDFPAFGKSEEPKQPYQIFDYEKIVIKILNKERIIRPVLVGHSFGGRIAILLASDGYASKMVLVDSAGLKPTQQSKYKNLY